ncbi:hypothetical protein ACJIZ3_002433 [Penstemon smallii]|uniref:Uncharacterized protein n=1 Tax=Penstemon smallii TaxID=265156 RepID=A0ABD3U6S6_9LAMI
MNSSADLEQLSPPPPPHHHHHHRQHRTKLVALAQKTFNNGPWAYIILLIFTFVLGYLSHSQPLLSQGTSDMIEHNSFPSQCSDPVPSNRVRQTIIDRVFNGTSPWESFPPAHVSPFLLKEWNKGWGSNNPVGTFLGASATHMAGLTRRLGLESQIICIDDFRGWPGYSDEEKSSKMVNGDTMLLYQFMQNVVNANATESIVFLPYSTSTALVNGLCEWGVYGDLVEIDAAHDFHSAWIDINNAYKVLKKPGGVMFGHDYAWVGVRKAVHSFARLNGFRVKLDGEHWVLY